MYVRAASCLFFFLFVCVFFSPGGPFGCCRNCSLASLSCAVTL
jgi:hypothetical protein